MDLLRSEIVRVTRYKPELGLDYYNDLLDIIDAYHEKKPDTSIETCKAIIEGISKLIIHKLTQEPIHILDKSTDLKDLAKKALEALDSRHNTFDIDISRSLVNVVRIIGEIRNSHCDIGHGRASIKEQINCPDLSQMVSGITENLVVYLIRKLDEIVEADNLYDSEQMQFYNDWLDENADITGFPITAEKFSKILFLHERESYNIMYQDFILAEAKESEKIVDIKQELISETRPFEIITDSIIETNLEKQQLSGNKLENVFQFAKTENLDVEKLQELIARALTFDKQVAQHDVFDLMLETPALKERKLMTEQLVERINILIKTLM